jgi:oligopeptide/dipeptide ABC transporter ATP-binding protein
MEIRKDSPNVVSLLKIKGLCKIYRSDSFLRSSFRAVDNVDMEVSSGEIRGIVGESGSGKTTLARCSLRLIEPSAGSVYFAGQDLSVLSAAALRARRKEFQMIFQDPYASLNPDMTVEQILMEPLQVHRVGNRDFRERRIRELLEAVSLSASLINRKPSELSGGQQQRAGIARGLILNPRLVIADEPVSALDASVQAQILNLLAELKKQYDLTLILISHSLNALHYLCTHISVMYKGRLVEEAPAERFFDGPKHPYSKILLNSMPSLDSFRQKISDCAKAIALSSDEQSGCAFHPYCSYRLPECVEQVPKLKDVSVGETVACFLYSQASAKQEK